MAQAIESHWTALNNACSYFQPSPWAFEAKSAPTPTIEDLMDLQQNSELIDQVRITEREYEEAMEHYQGWILESWCWTYTEPSILKDELGPLLTRKGEESLASAQAFLMDELEWLSAGCRAASELGLRYIEALNDAQDIPQAEIFDWISAKAYMNEMSVTATSVFGLLDELDGMSDTNKRKEKEKYRSACQHWSDTVLEVQRNS
ncbi:uncharacterized protein I303_104227 [Kwoniella dejecticola CBS 10117]|uniref:Uncharacterized protein n=1 Tax=Kwoniella dejecticola CBS 10117 TaxID=1296121 RepID=A0A1A6A5X8_9TREE|nr:uncharacterized protein I303_04796 [Kwoniella dejecticola CBS 10117]OBR85460.1 hypothetical protein I303_04796 [Kwoniella dejecticola CBS 10117]